MPLVIKSAPASQDYLRMAKDLLDAPKTRNILAAARRQIWLVLVREAHSNAVSSYQRPPGDLHENLIQYRFATVNG